MKVSDRYAPVPTLGYMPSLDGWRAFAIVAVMLYHDAFVLSPRLQNVKDMLAIGVTLFFAISGFLICNRILEDEQARGRFSIKDFYIRRVSRIQPAALVYLAVVAVLMLAGVLHEHWRIWLGGLLLYQNFLFDGQHTLAFNMRTVFTGHFWTLAVEEQFYLMLSTLLLFVRRWRLQVFGLLLVGLMLLNRLMVSVFHMEPTNYSRATWWSLPYLLLPAVLAILLRSPAWRAGFRRWLPPWRVFGLSLLVLVLDWRFVVHAHFLSLDTLYHWYPLLGYMFAFWIISTALHPLSWTSRLLSLAPVTFVGRLSYSLYLWHPLFFLAARPIVGVTWPPLAFLSHAPWRYVATFAAAYASYRLVEVPCIRLGHKLAGGRAAIQPAFAPEESATAAYEPVLAAKH